MENSTYRKRQILLDFLKEWKEWTEVAKKETRWSLPNGYIYERHEGLCTAFTRYIRMNHTMDTATCRGIHKALTKSFVDDRLSPVYPFGKEAYYECAYDRNSAMYDDEARMSWVDKTIERLEVLNANHA